MAYDDLEISNTDKTSEHRRLFEETFIKMQRKYPNVMGLFPVMVHQDFRCVILGFLQEYLKSNNYINHQLRWANVLGMSQEDLINTLKKSE